MACTDFLKLESRKRKPQQNGLNILKEDASNDLYRLQLGDFYCVVCDAQMDTGKIWENHINGSRHFINSRRYEYSNEKPAIHKKLKRETRPIVGLDYICEFLLYDRLPVYQCLLCSAGLTTSTTLFEHLNGLKHQMAFLEQHVKEKYSILISLSLSKSELQSLVLNILSRYEQKHGRGEMSVQKQKKHGLYFSNKKFYVDDYHKRDLPSSVENFSSLNSFRYSPTNYNKKTKHLHESECKDFSFRGRSKKRRYEDKPYYSNAEIGNIEPKPLLYRKHPTHVDKPDSRSEENNLHFPSRSSICKSETRRDLREVLEQKKNPFGKANMDKSAYLPFSSHDDDVSDILSRMSSKKFLKLVSSKLDKLDVKEGKELKLLDLVIKKATQLSMNVKKQIPAQSFKENCNDTLVPKSISKQECSVMDTSFEKIPQFPRKLDNFIMLYKALKTTVNDDVHFHESSNYSHSSKKCTDNNSMPCSQLDSPSQCRNDSKVPVLYDSKLNHQQSN